VALFWAKVRKKGRHTEILGGQKLVPVGMSDTPLEKDPRWGDLNHRLLDGDVSYCLF
jgi:hypothetical protein